jgi:very-short-patch-repair endonuclease
MAAVLACGSGAVLSHLSAATLWELLLPWPDAVHVTAATYHHHPGVVLHRSRSLDQVDVTEKEGIPVTTPARTLVDLGGILDGRSLTRVFNDARVRRLTSSQQVLAAVARSPGRTTARLRRLAEEGLGPTRSQLEDAFIAFLKRHRLPPPEVNQAVLGYEVDMLWRERGLIVELDGYRFHGTRVAFEQDRRRDADLMAGGYRVVRVTWRRLKDEPRSEAQRLRSLLTRLG